MVVTQSYFPNNYVRKNKWNVKCHLLILYCLKIKKKYIIIKVCLLFRFRILILSRISSNVIWAPYSGRSIFRLSVYTRDAYAIIIITRCVCRSLFSAFETPLDRLEYNPHYIIFVLFVNCKFNLIFFFFYWRR